MAVTLEERVAYLEGKVEEHSKALEDIKDLIINLDQKVDRRIDALDQKVDRFREELSVRINHLDGRINHLDGRINHLDGRIDAIDHKFSRYFLWIIGIQITILLAVIAALMRP